MQLIPMADNQGRVMEVGIYNLYFGVYDRRILFLIFVYLMYISF